MSAIDENREEVWNFFKSTIAPKIRNGASLQEVEQTAKQLGSKYVSVVKTYDNTIRVSMNKKSNGIIYFMAETREGKEDYRFREPSYGWRNIK